MKAWIIKNANENHDKKTDKKSLSHRHRILSLMTSAILASQSIVLLNSSPVMAESSPSNLLEGYENSMFDKQIKSLILTPTFCKFINHQRYQEKSVTLIYTDTSPDNLNSQSDSSSQNILKFVQIKNGICDENSQKLTAGEFSSLGTNPKGYNKDEFVRLIKEKISKEYNDRQDQNWNYLKDYYSVLLLVGITAQISSKNFQILILPRMGPLVMTLITVAPYVYWHVVLPGIDLLIRDYKLKEIDKINDNLFHSIPIDSENIHNLIVSVLKEIDFKLK